MMVLPALGLRAGKATVSTLLSSRAHLLWRLSALTPFSPLQEALAQPLGGNISAQERQELERRAEAMRAAAARLQRVSAVRGDQPASKQAEV